MLVLLTVIGFAIYLESQKGVNNDEIQAKLSQYNESVPRYLVKKKFSKKRLPVVGKIVIIDAKLVKVIPYEEYLIGSKYRPSNPEEVNTAIIQDCDYAVVGKYTNGASALQEECSIHIIDVETQTWSYWGTVKGSEPSDEIKRHRGSSSDEKGSKAMFEFLKQNSI